MKTTIDSAGRIVVPKAIREAASLEDGTELDIRMMGDHIRIEPVPLEVKLTKKGKFVVAIPKTSPGKLTREDVEETRRTVLQQREDSYRKK